MKVFINSFTSLTWKIYVVIGIASAIPMKHYKPEICVSLSGCVSTLQESVPPLCRAAGAGTTGPT